jgi:hypothetical protein
MSSQNIGSTIASLCFSPFSIPNSCVSPSPTFQLDDLCYSAVKHESKILCDFVVFFSIAKCEACHPSSDIVLDNETMEWLMNGPSMDRMHIDIKAWLCKRRDEQGLAWSWICHTMHSSWPGSWTFVGSSNPDYWERQLCGYLSVCLLVLSCPKGDTTVSMHTVQYSALAICSWRIRSSHNELSQKRIASFHHLKSKLENSWSFAQDFDIIRNPNVNLPESNSGAITFL